MRCWPAASTCRPSAPPTDPKVFTKIHLHFRLTGRGLAAAAVERAIALSHEKYCSATIMLSATAKVTTSFEIAEAAYQMWWAVRVMTRAARRIACFTGSGSARAPAA